MLRTTWSSWVPESKSVPLAPDSRRWASMAPRVASPTDRSVLPATSPSETWLSSTQPTRETTTAERTSVLTTTRAWMERLQKVQTPRAERPRAALLTASTTFTAYAEALSGKMRPRD